MAPSIPNTTERQQKRGLGPLIIGLSFALFIIVAAGAAVYLFKTTILQTGYSENRAPLAISINNERLTIPENMIRFAEQRRNGHLDRLDLAFLWPEGTGYSEQTRKAFAVLTPEQRVIYLTIQPRKIAMDMSARLHTHYKPLFESAARPLSEGLVLQALKRGHGYDGEELAIYWNEMEPWVARCRIGPETELNTCIRDINFGSSLSATVRFSRRLLPNWRSVEAVTQSLLNRLRSD